MKKKQQQTLIIGGVIIAVVLTLAGLTTFFAVRSNSNKSAPTPTESPRSKKKITEPVNQIPVSDRPYAQIRPFSDGRNVEIIINTVPKAADSLEYELEYQAGTLLQGAFGQIELTTLPATSKILLGSCSAGGSCTYHENVQGGSLLLRFQGEDESYALKQDWRYFDNWGSKDSLFASKDAKFQLDSPALAKQRFVIVYNSPGYPSGLTGTPVSDSYSLTGSNTLAGTATVTMHAQEEGSLKLLGYDGTTWTEIAATVEGKTVTATSAPLMELYVVVK